MVVITQITQRIYVQILTLVILIISMSPTSLAQGSYLDHVYTEGGGHLATLICTEHRNELAARGLGPIFIHKNKYCVAFTDSSQQILEDFADWIYNSIFEVFTGTVANASAINHNKDKQETGFLDEFINWVTGENFSGDMDRYAGNGQDQYATGNIKDTSVATDTDEDKEEGEEGEVVIPIAR